MRILLSALTLFLLSGAPTSAQFDSSLLSGINLQPDLPEIRLEPKSPEPGEVVTASVNAYASELAGASITWSYGGVEIPESQNKTKVTFVADGNGMTKNLSVSFTTPSGVKRVSSRGLTPIYIDIIVEPQTHVPDFYLGRPMPSVGSSINATAIISGLGSPNNYAYTWRYGRVVIDGLALRGRSSVTFDAPLDKNIILSLEVKNMVSGETVAEKTVSIPSVDPVVRFYEANTLLGLKQIPIERTFSLVGNSASLRAEPYYLDSRVYNNPDILEWKIDNIVYENSRRNPYEVVLQKNTTGRSQLNFHVRSKSQLLQGAYGNVGINL